MACAARRRRECCMRNGVGRGNRTGGRCPQLPGMRVSASDGGTASRRLTRSSTCRSAFDRYRRRSSSYSSPPSPASSRSRCTEGRRWDFCRRFRARRPRRTGSRFVPSCGRVLACCSAPTAAQPWSGRDSSHFRRGRTPGTEPRCRSSSSRPRRGGGASGDRSWPSSTRAPANEVGACCCSTLGAASRRRASTRRWAIAWRASFRATWSARRDSAWTT